MVARYNDGGRFSYSFVTSYRFEKDTARSQAFWHEKCPHVLLLIERPEGEYNISATSFFIFIFQLMLRSPILHNIDYVFCPL